MKTQITWVHEDLNYMVQFFLATCNAIILKILQVAVGVQPAMMHIIANEFTLIAGYSASWLAKFLSVYGVHVDFFSFGRRKRVEIQIFAPEVFRCKIISPAAAK